jgi:hypothetical protein
VSFLLTEKAIDGAAGATEEEEENTGNAMGKIHEDDGSDTM